MKNKLNSLFNLKEYNTTVKGEILAGLTSFFAIVLIIEKYN
ncbi:hypothetical protein ACXAUS_000257 [Clostridium sporogenes]|nr:hypothetical protein [Clostridium botulinum]